MRLGPDGKRLAGHLDMTAREAQAGQVVGIVVGQHRGIDAHGGILIEGQGEIKPGQQIAGWAAGQHPALLQQTR
jgi:hypothetical protein